MNASLNVDPNEIAKFEKMAAQWWDLNGDFKPLHDINPLRREYIEEKANGVFGKTILDVGCGGGILSESLAKSGAVVTGIDMGKEPLTIAKLHALETQTQITYLQSTAETHAEEYPQQYDIVTCMEMLEHVPNPLSVIQACAKLVKPNGHVFFSTLNRNAKSYIFAIIGAEYIMKMVPKGTHDHKKFIRPSELLGMVDSTSLKERHITGLQYNPLTQRYRLDKNVDVNYIVHTQDN
jgi:2-polyprenyl-6-hydroxyphenyl methylase/3-demethylubiquinone-9 3-methyltransferase